MVKHPNVISLYEIIETQKQLYLIMEYACGGELFNYIVARSKLKEPQACLFFQQLLSGVEYLQRVGVVHRDLKPENLLLDENNNLKIVDFGLSNTYKGEEMLKTACGSPCYAAPEMIAGKRYYGSRVDVWSCGVVLFAMVCGYLPFEDPNTSSLYKKILSGEYKCASWVSAEAKDMLKRILNTNPECRFTVGMIRSHPWFTKNSSKQFPNFLQGETLKIDETILKKVEELGLSSEITRDSLIKNKHNKYTSTYYLLLKKERNEQVLEKLNSRVGTVNGNFRGDSHSINPRLKKLFEYSENKEEELRVKNEERVKVELIKPAPRRRIYYNSVERDGRAASTGCPGIRISVVPKEPVMPKPSNRRNYRPMHTISPVSHVNTLNLSFKVATARAGTALDITTRPVENRYYTIK